MAESSSSSSGIGFVGLLTCLFVGLKLTHFIQWSWWWVVSPVWIATTLWLVIVALVILVAWIVEGNKRRKRREERTLR